MKIVAWSGSEDSAQGSASHSEGLPRGLLEGCGASRRPRGQRCLLIAFSGHPGPLSAASLTMETAHLVTPFSLLPLVLVTKPSSAPEASRVLRWPPPFLDDFLHPDGHPLTLRTAAALSKTHLALSPGYPIAPGAPTFSPSTPQGISPRESTSRYWTVGPFWRVVHTVQTVQCRSWSIFGGPISVQCRSNCTRV